MTTTHPTHAPIHYRVELPDLNSHLYQVTLTVPEPDACQRLTLPAWIPGSYLIREFARHLQGLQARQGRRTLDVVQTGQEQLGGLLRAGSAPGASLRRLCL